MNDFTCLGCGYEMSGTEYADFQAQATDATLNGYCSDACAAKGPTPRDDD